MFRFYIAVKVVFQLQAYLQYRVKPSIAQCPLLSSVNRLWKQKYIFITKLPLPMSQLTYSADFSDLVGTRLSCGHRNAPLLEHYGGKMIKQLAVWCWSNPVSLCLSFLSYCFLTLLIFSLFLLSFHPTCTQLLPPQTCLSMSGEAVIPPWLAFLQAKFWLVQRNHPERTQPAGPQLLASKSTTTDRTQALALAAWNER